MASRVLEKYRAQNPDAINKSDTEIARELYEQSYSDLDLPSFANRVEVSPVDLAGEVYRKNYSDMEFRDFADRVGVALPEDTSGMPASATGPGPATGDSVRSQPRQTLGDASLLEAAGDLVGDAGVSNTSEGQRRGTRPDVAPVTGEALNAGADRRARRPEGRQPQGETVERETRLARRAQAEVEQSDVGRRFDVGRQDGLSQAASFAKGRNQSLTGEPLGVDMNVSEAELAVERNRPLIERMGEDLETGWLRLRSGLETIGATTGTLSRINDRANRIEELRNAGVDARQRLAGAQSEGERRVAEAYEQRMLNAQQNDLPELVDEQKEDLARFQDQLSSIAELQSRQQENGGNPFVRQAIETGDAGLFLERLRQDPLSTISGLLLESGPMMALSIGSSIALGRAGGPAGFAVGAGIGSATAEFGAVLEEKIAEFGGDFNDPESVRRVMDEHGNEIIQDSSIRAGAVALMDSLGARVASSRITPRAAEGASTASRAGRFIGEQAAQSSVQAATGGGGNLIGQAFTEDEINAAEVMAEAVAEFGFAPIEVGAAGITGARRRLSGDDGRTLQQRLTDGGFDDQGGGVYRRGDVEVQVGDGEAVARVVTEPVAPSDDDTEQTTFDTIDAEINQLQREVVGPSRDPNTPDPDPQTLADAEQRVDALLAQREQITEQMQRAQPVGARPDQAETPDQELDFLLGEFGPQSNVETGQSQIPDLPARIAENQRQIDARREQLRSAGVPDDQIDIDPTVRELETINQRAAQTLSSLQERADEQQANAAIDRNRAPTDDALGGQIEQTRAETRDGMREEIQRLRQMTTRPAPMTDGAATTLQQQARALRERSRVQPVDEGALPDRQPRPTPTLPVNNPATGEFVSERVSTENIEIDPQTYQFRDEVNRDGVDDRLEGITQFDDLRAGTVILHERDDGRTFVADGHHRIDLARRLNRDSINAIVLRESEGFSAADARRYAAERNIAEGNATPIDAAKVFRETGGDPATVIEDRNLPRRSQVVRDGAAIARLGDEAFGAVLNEQITEKDAAAIGRNFTDTDQQLAAVQQFQRSRPANESQRQILADDIRQAGFSEGEQGGLFGDDPAESLITERMQVKDALTRRLSRSRSLFRTLNDNAGTAERAGNQIARDQNAAIQQDAAIAADLVRQADTTPELNQAINAAAQRVKDGEPVSRVAAELEQRIINEAQQLRAQSQGIAPDDRAGSADPAGQDAGGGEPARPGDAGRDVAGGEQRLPGAESKLLTQPTPESLRARDQAQADAQAAQADADRRADADAMRDDFTLTGSDTEADQVAARGQDTLFSRGNQQGGGLDAREAATRAADLMQGWKIAPRIDVVQSENDLPRSIRREIAMSRGRGAVRGVFHRGRVYVVADNLQSFAEMEETVLHEVIGHFGLRNVLGSDMQSVIDDVYRSIGDDLLRPIATQRGLDLSNTDQRNEAVEEYLAELAQTDPSARIIDRIVRLVAEWARSMGFSLSLTNAEMRELIVRAKRFVQDGEIVSGMTVQSSVGGGIAFQRAFHGTPHSFDRFTLDAIGTGEGNQAYGWGLYFSGARDVAEFYRSAVTRQELRRRSTPESVVDQYFLDNEVTPESITEAISEFDRLDQSRGQIQSDYDGRFSQAANLLRDGYRPQPGSVYQVNIPEDSELLDWDAALSDQPSVVGEALEGLDDDVKAAINDDLDRRVLSPMFDEDGKPDGDYTGGEFYRALERVAPEFPPELSNGPMVEDAIDRGQGDRAVSMWLRNEGVLGLRYFDGMSRAQSDGSRNYVIWEEQAIDIAPSDGQPDGARFSFAGTGSQTADLGNLEEAKALRNTNMSPEVIRQRTGWFVGVDGKWRYEITDDGAALIGNIRTDQASGFYRLDQILDHQKLYAAYPDLGGLLVHVRSLDNYKGLYRPNDDIIEMDITSDREAFLSTLLHEVQHAIQHREGFATGGTSNKEFWRNIKSSIQDLDTEARNRVLGWQFDNQALIDQAEEASFNATMGLAYQSAQRLREYASRERPSSVFRLIRREAQWIYEPTFDRTKEGRRIQGEFFNIPKRGPRRNEALSRLAYDAAELIESWIPDELISEFRADERKLDNMVRALRRNADRARERTSELTALQREAQRARNLRESRNLYSPFDTYRALAGEIEARNTQARQSMTAEERARRSPEATQDIRSEEAIVIVGGAELVVPQTSLEDRGSKAAVRFSRKGVNEANASKEKTASANRSGLPLKFRNDAAKATTSYVGKDRQGNSVTVKTADPALREQNALQAWLKKKFTKEGQLTDRAYELHTRMLGERNAAEVDISGFTADFMQSVTRAYGRSYTRLGDDEKAALNEYLAGQDVRDIPESVKAELDVMRGMLDNMSTRTQMMLLDEVRYALQDMGGDQAATVAELIRRAKDGDNEAIGEIREVSPHGNLIARKMRTFLAIEANKGGYLHRSYRAFDDPSWKDNVPDDVMRRAKSYLRGQVRLDPTLQGLDADGIEDRVDGIIGAILNSNSSDMVDFLSQRQLGEKDLSVLKQRENIPEPIRDLMGEYKDPRVNFSRTMSHMSTLLASHHFLRSVREEGLGAYLSTRESGRMNTEITSFNEEKMLPLAGLYTTPEFRQALIDFAEGDSLEGWMKGVVTLTSSVKYGKTVLSPTTMFRNFYSASMFTVMNGHFGYSNVIKAAQTTWSDIRGNTRARRDYMRRLAELGVIHDSARAGEITAALDDIMDLDTTKGSAPARGLKQGLNIATRMYQAGDDFWKIVGFETERKELIESGMAQDEAEALAAKRVRDGYPTYSMVPEAIQRLRRFPLVGTFVSFPWEVMRTSWNQFRMVREDMQAGRNAKAARRLVGMSIAYSSAYAIKTATMAMFGIDDEEDEAIRKLAAPWEMNSQFAYLGHDEDGRLRYLDLSHLDPYNHLKRLITALMNGNYDNVGEGFIAGIKEFLAPYFGTDITAGALGEAVFNKKQSSGAPVRDENADPLVQGYQTGEHLLSALRPGILLNVERTWKAYNGQMTSYGREYTLEDEAMAWVGFRLTTSDPKVSMQFKALDFDEQRMTAGRPTYRTLRNPNRVSDRDMRSSVQSTYDRWREGFEEMHAVVRAARVAGLSDQEIAEALDKGGVPKRDIGPIIREIVPPWSPSDQSMQNAINSVLQFNESDEMRENLRERFRAMRRAVIEQRRKLAEGQAGQ